LKLKTSRRREVSKHRHIEAAFAHVWKSGSGPLLACDERLPIAVFILSERPPVTDPPLSSLFDFAEARDLISTPAALPKLAQCMPDLNVSKACLDRFIVRIQQIENRLPPGNRFGIFQQAALRRPSLPSNEATFERFGIVTCNHEISSLTPVLRINRVHYNVRGSGRDITVQAESSAEVAALSWR
jgi:hypothetical protein